TAQVYCLLTAVLLCLSGCLSTTDATRSKASAKPGECPPEKPVGGSCARSCTGDSDCPDNEKCCSNGCGHRCTAPYTGIRIKNWMILMFFLVSNVG
uniref:WAP domain-containing protein n=1 Tax=Sinocyclocheilus anshuiensis TaxID=1608454 RepID=A0A671SFZ2_9TELE